MNGALKLVRIAPTVRADDARAIYREITESDQTFDLGDGWAAIHFMLTGETPMPKHVAVEHGQKWDDNDVENALMGGDATTVEDAFTVARVLPPEQVATLAPLLAAKRQTFASKFDDEARKCLPASWDDDIDVGGVLATKFDELVEWFKAAAAGDGLLLYVE